MRLDDFFSMESFAEDVWSEGGRGQKNVGQKNMGRRNFDGRDIELKVLSGKFGISGDQ